MSVNELKQFFPIIPPVRAWNRLIELRYINTRKALRKSYRLTRSRLRHWYRTQYFITNAWRESLRAIKANEDICVGVMFICLTTLFGLMYLASNILYTFMDSAMGIADAFGVSIVAVSGVAGFVFALTTAWLVALLLSSLAVAIRQGMHRTVYRSILSTLRRGLHEANRLVVSWLMLLVILLLPVFMLSVVLFTAVLTELIDFDKFEQLLPYTVVTALGWVIVSFMDYALLPIVRLFEHEKTMTQALARTHNLVRGRGRLFILGSLGLALLPVGLVYAVTKIAPAQIGNKLDILLWVTALTVSITWTMIMTALYRRRSQSRLYCSGSKAYR